VYSPFVASQVPEADVAEGGDVLDVVDVADMVDVVDEVVAVGVEMVADGLLTMRPTSIPGWSCGEP
jgi:hypothetical protein